MGKYKLEVKDAMTTSFDPDVRVRAILEYPTHVQIKLPEQIVNILVNVDYNPDPVVQISIEDKKCTE